MFGRADTEPISKKHYNALRHADTICFDYVDGASRIRAIRDGHENGTGFDQTVYVPVGSRLNVYGDNSHEREIVKGYVFRGSAQHDDQLKTIWRLLQTGDEIVLEWAADAGNAYVDGSVYQGQRLYQDTLRLHVYHETERTEKHYVFLVETSTCPDNTARLVQTR